MTTAASDWLDSPCLRKIPTVSTRILLVVTPGIARRERMKGSFQRPSAPPRRNLCACCPCLQRSVDEQSLRHDLGNHETADRGLRQEFPRAITYVAGNNELNSKTREGCKGQVWGENRKVCVAHWKEPHGADRERVSEGVSILEVDALKATNELGEPLGSSRTPQQHYKRIILRR